VSRSVEDHPFAQRIGVHAFDSVVSVGVSAARRSGCLGPAAARSRNWPGSSVAHRQSLRNWASQLDIDEGKAERLTSDEREELRRLRREARTLTEEREILRKRRSFIAKVSETRR